jgi:hypothetical protein
MMPSFEQPVCRWRIMNRRAQMPREDGELIVRGENHPETQFFGDRALRQKQKHKT